MGLAQSAQVLGMGSVAQAVFVHSSSKLSFSAYVEAGCILGYKPSWELLADAPIAYNTGHLRMRSTSTVLRYSELRSEACWAENGLPFAKWRTADRVLAAQKPSQYCNQNLTRLRLTLVSPRLAG
jgi:hypothetical protein